MPKRDNRKKSVTLVKKAEPAPAVEMPLHRVDWFYPCFMCVVIAAAVLRFYFIDNRPLHNDEGVNFFFLGQIKDKGYFPYSHENYHGPSYFYLTYLFWRIVGDSELGLRFSAALVGTGTLFLLLLLREIEDDFFLLIGALLLAVSPALVFYSRYAIHETLFLFSGTLFAICAYRFWRDPSARWIYGASIGLGLLITTKETFIITLFSVFLALLSLGRLKEPLKKLFAPGSNLFVGLFVTAVIVVLLFTGGLQWGGGLREMLLAVPQWIGRNSSDTGHHKPFGYYMAIIASTEPYLYLSVALGALVLILKTKLFTWARTSKRDALIIFLSVWFVVSLLVYSYVKYKTPWLIINVTLPGVLAAAWWLSRLMSGNRLMKQSGGVLVALCAIIGSLSTSYYVFSEPYGSKNPFSYVHTSKGMIDLVQDIEVYWRNHPNARVLIGVDQYWPLPYYFRNHANLIEYMSVEKNEKWQDELERYKDKYGVMIVGSKMVWAKPGWGQKYYRLSDVQETRTYFKRAEEPAVALPPQNPPPG